MTQGFPETEYFSYLASGKFMIQHSPKSGRHVFYPRLAEPLTGDPLVWVRACGRGTVYSVTVLHPKPPEAAYNVALIDLEEGPRMLSRWLVTDAALPVIGQRVRVRFPSVSGQKLPFFSSDMD